MPKLAVVERDDPPLSGARQELARASERLANARSELEAAQRPARRLERVVAELSAIEGDLERLRSADAGVLAEWLAGGGDGARPEPSAETLRSEQLLIGLRRDGTAAQSGLPSVREAVQRCAERVRDAGRAQETALLRAALEAAETYAAGPWLEALNAALRHQAVLEGLRQALLTIGHRPPEGSPHALGAAAELAELIGSTRARAGAALGHGTHRWVGPRLVPGWRRARYPIRAPPPPG